MSFYNQDLSCLIIRTVKCSKQLASCSWNKKWQQNAKYEEDELKKLKFYLAFTENDGKTDSVQN